MSRKNPQGATARSPSSPTTNKPAPAAPASSARRGVVLGVGAAALTLATGGVLVYGGRQGSAAQAAAQRAGLASEHAPAFGPATAKVHIVEFLDPACETCASFYPLVKQIMADAPGRIRLFLRHLPFHPGVEEVVRMLEASRAQGLYAPVLETLLAQQARWTLRHHAHADLARQVLAGTGLDFARLDADMRAPEVAQRMARDAADAQQLQVQQTPEYFVNGRGLPSFGREQLQTLVRQALQEAYR